MTAACSPAQRHRIPRDDAFVWFSGMGLSAGLLMVLLLLAVIVWHGLSVFWPRRVVEADVKSGGVVCGEVVARQRKPAATGPLPDRPWEWQFYTANKRFTGVPFRFVDVAELQHLRQPADVLKVERTENGNALCYPVALKFADGREVKADTPEFARELAALVHAAAERRQQLRQLEKFAIGAINREMNSLALNQRVVERQAAAGAPADPAAAERHRVQQAALQQQFDRLHEQVKALRQEQQATQFVHRLADGTETATPVGDIIHYYYPNRLSWVARVGLFGRNLWQFVATEPREANTEGGIFPAIFGTFVMTVLMSLLVTPFGVLAAVYMYEYARQGFVLRAVRVAVNNLAGVPSIVFGVFGLGFFVYVVGAGVDALFFSDALPTPTFGTGGLLWASLTLALLTLPVVIVAAEEALAAVPRGVREASLACGATKWQTIRRVVMPAALPGIITGMILAMARGAGEVAPLMMVGVVKLAPELPLNTAWPFVHLNQKFMHLGFHIYDLGFQSPDAEAAKPMVFATTLLLIVLVVVMNLGGIVIRDRLRRKYATGVF